MVRTQGPFASATWFRYPKIRKNLGFLPAFWVARGGLAAAKPAQIGPACITSSTNFAHAFWTALAVGLGLLGAIR